MKPHEKFVGEPDCKHSFPRKTRESPGPVEQRQPLLRALDRQRSDQVILAARNRAKTVPLEDILHLPGQLVEVEPGKPALVEHLPRQHSRNRRSRSRTSFCLRVSVLREG